MHTNKHTADIHKTYMYTHMVAYMQTDRQTVRPRVKRPICLIREAFASINICIYIYIYVSCVCVPVLRFVLSCIYIYI